jgi:hypothetical protein
MNQRRSVRKTRILDSPNPLRRPLLTPVTRLSTSELIELKQWVEADPAYTMHESFFKRCDPDMLIMRLAEYHFPKKTNLEDRIQKGTGKTRKQIESLRKRLIVLAEDVASLNTVELPGGLHFAELVRRFGDPEVDAGDIEESMALAYRLDCLPTFLREYSRTLKGWPHPSYRKLLSGRNWDAYRLVQLCLWVKAITGDFHYAKIAGLLTVAADFAETRFNEPRAQPILEDHVRHNIANFKLRNPPAYERADQLARLAAERYKEDQTGNEIAAK